MDFCSEWKRFLFNRLLIFHLLTSSFVLSLISIHSSKLFHWERLHGNKNGALLLYAQFAGIKCVSRSPFVYICIVCHAILTLFHVRGDEIFISPFDSHYLMVKCIFWGAHSGTNYKSGADSLVTFLQLRIVIASLNSLVPRAFPVFRAISSRALFKCFDNFFFFFLL